MCVATSLVWLHTCPRRTHDEDCATNVHVCICVSVQGDYDEFDEEEMLKEAEARGLDFDTAKEMIFSGKGQLLKGKAFTSPEETRQHAAILAANFDKLPIEKQVEMLHMDETAEIEQEFERVRTHSTRCVRTSTCSHRLRRRVCVRVRV